MKKWLFGVIACFFLIIGALVYRSSTMDLEDYMKAADRFAQQDNQQLVIFNLNKALEKAAKRYGDVSPETAEIYCRLGSETDQADEAEEYFGKACSIYEALEEPGEMARIQYMAGVSLIGLRKQEAAGKAFEEAIRLYEENGYETADNLCMAYMQMADMQEDVEASISYLHKAEELTGELSPEQETGIQRSLYASLGIAFFWEEDYDKALTYYEKLMDRSDEGIKTADASLMYGACLAYTGDTKAAGACLDQAIETFRQAGESTYYLQCSMAYTNRALVYAYQDQPDPEKAMECGKKALSYFTDRRSIGTVDMRFMEYCKKIMTDVFKKAYPDKELWQFDDWFAANSRLHATSYEYTF